MSDLIDYGGNRSRIREAEAVAAARRVKARRAARRQHKGVTFAPGAEVVFNELGTFVEGSLLYKVDDA